MPCSCARSRPPDGDGLIVAPTSPDRRPFALCKGSGGPGHRRAAGGTPPRAVVTRSVASRSGGSRSRRCRRPAAAAGSATRLKLRTHLAGGVEDRGADAADRVHVGRRRGRSAGTPRRRGRPAAGAAARRGRATARSSSTWARSDCWVGGARRLDDEPEVADRRPAASRSCAACAASAVGSRASQRRSRASGPQATNTMPSGGVSGTVSPSRTAGSRLARRPGVVDQPGVVDLRREGEAGACRTAPTAPPSRVGPRPAPGSGPRPPGPGARAPDRGGSDDRARGPRTPPPPARPACARTTPG